MEKLKIAIIGGSSTDALANACRRMGHYGICFNGSKNDRGYGDGDKNYLIDLKETNKIVSIIKMEADCLLLGSGHEYAHSIAKELFDSGFCVSVNPYTTKYGKNKRLAYEFINDLGYRTPKYQVITTYEELEKKKKSIELPVVIKSENDKVRTAKANNDEEFDLLIKEHLDKDSKAIIEEFIDGVEYTMPVMFDGNKYIGYPKALYMSDINKIAVAHLRNFSNLDEKYDRQSIMTLELEKEIERELIDITESMQLEGFVRFDLMVSADKKIYVLEVNECATSRLGPDHYPWEEIGMEPAIMMVENIISKYKNSCRLTD